VKANAASGDPQAPDTVPFGDGLRDDPPDDLRHRDPSRPGASPWGSTAPDALGAVDTERAPASRATATPPTGDPAPDEAAATARGPRSALRSGLRTFPRPPSSQATHGSATPTSGASDFERGLARAFFAFGGITCGIAAALVLVTPTPMVTAWRVSSAAGLALAMLACAALARRVPEVRLAPWVTAVGVLGASLALVLAAVVGQGVHAVTVVFLPLIVAVVAVVAGGRAAAWVSAVVGLGLVALVTAEVQDWIPGAGAVPDSSLAGRAVAVTLVLASAVSLGIVIGRVVRRAVSDAAEREQRFRSLLGMAADWYWELDAEHRFTVAEERTPGASGMAPERRLGARPWEVGDIGLSDAQRVAHRADIEARRGFEAVLLRRTGADGQVRTLSVSGQPRFDAGGAFVGHWGVGRDVTAEVMAQQAVAASEARYRELFARSPSAVLLHRQGRVIDANQAAARLFGLASPAELMGVSIPDELVQADARETSWQRVRQLETLSPGQGVPVVEMALRPRHGPARMAEVTALRVDTPTGPASMTILFDVTERLAVQASLRRSEALLSLVVASSPDAVALTDIATGRYLMVSDRFCAIFGWSREQIVGRTSTELGLWRHPQDRQRLIDDVIAHGRSAERLIEFSGEGGRRVQLKVSGSVFAFDGRQLLITQSRDVSSEERSRIERAAILEHASVGIALTRGGRFELTNQRFEQMLGYASGELLGREAPTIAADAQGQELLRASHGPAQAASTAQGSFEGELALATRDGASLWCRVRARAIDPNEPAAGTIWIAEDVSGQRASQEALARALDDAQAASRAKSAFLANTSHELRTPLNGLLGLARLALQPGTSNERRQQHLQQIHDSAQSLAHIISDILDLSRIEAGKLVIEHRVFDLHAVAEAVRQLNQPVAEARGLALNLSITPAVPRHVVGDALRVRQILANYVANALKFTERGRVDIALGARPGPLPGLAKPGAVGSSLLIRLEVRDTGLGIAPEQRERLFNPFSQADESTTRRFGGTGLGLSICRELATAMRGEVGVESESGRGSRFWAELPMTVAAPRAAEALAQGASDHPIPPARRVLVVEDHPVNMLVATTLMRQWGLVVSEAENGAEALQAVARAQAAAAPFHLVVMDVQMPVMGGHEAARALRQSHTAEQLPIIALTAAALVSERDAALNAGMNDFVTKPVDPAQLRAAVSRQLLGHARVA
jgi:PAS domain S-box-containing protein